MKSPRKLACGSNESLGNSGEKERQRKEVGKECERVEKKGIRAERGRGREKGM